LILTADIPGYALVVFIGREADRDVHNTKNFIKKGVIDSVL
jgi:hypothetical protein